MAGGMRAAVHWALNDVVRRNASITHALFGVRPRAGERIQWDFTTLVLRKALRDANPANRNILEIGTGPYAILPLYLERRFRCSIDACDVNAEYVVQAKRCITERQSGIGVFRSDLFENVYDQYDIIFSNTLYIPRGTGREHGIDAQHETETDWCGGDTGYEYIERLLDNARRHLHSKGYLLLGFNSFYLQEKHIHTLYKTYSYRLIRVTKMPFNPSRVYHLQICNEGENGLPEHAGGAL